MYDQFRHLDLKQHLFDTGHVRLNVVEGPNHGPALILIPGQTMPWQSYFKVLPALCQRYHCYAIDVRGHGQSERTPGQYSFRSCGDDVVAVLKELIQQPAFISGNSSGGVMAAYTAASVPDMVRGIVLEDAPIFSSEWPRLQQCYVHHLFGRCVNVLDTAPGRDLAAFFADFEVPSQDGHKVIRMPPFAGRLIAWFARRQQRKQPGQPLDLRFLPSTMRLFVRTLMEYDIDFTRAFWDGSACDIDHAEILSKIKCPTLVLHADWFIHQTFGLVGAMSDDDVARLVQIVPHAELRRLHTAHVVHQDKPAVYVRELNAFVDRARVGSSF